MRRILVSLYYRSRLAYLSHRVAKWSRRRRGLPATGAPKPPHEDRRYAPRPVPETMALAHALSELAEADAVVAGPWTGSPRHELLYWIPFLRWASQEFGIPRERLTAVSPAAPTSWYRGVAGKLVRAAPAGDAGRLAPDLLWNLVERYRAGRSPIGELLDRLVFERIEAPAGNDGLEAPFVALDPNVDPPGPFDSGALPPVVLDSSADTASLERLTSVVARATAFYGCYGDAAVVSMFAGTPVTALVRSPDDPPIDELDILYRASRKLRTPATVLEPHQLPLVVAVAHAGTAS